MQYTAVWQLPGSKPEMIRFRISPLGWDGAAYFNVDHIDKAGKNFKSHEEQRLPEASGAKAVVERYLVWVTAHPEAIPLFTLDDLALYPKDYLGRNGRRKTADELRLDEGMLWVEVGDFAAAEAALALIEKPTGMFFHSVKRRLYANTATALATSDPTRAAQYNEMAVQHALSIVEEFMALKRNDEYAEQRLAYHFGDGYKNNGSQLVGACLTLASHWLKQGMSEEALKIADYGLATNYGVGRLYELQVRALMALGRTAEAYPIFALHVRTGIPELSESAGYREYQRQEEQKSTAAEQALKESVRWAYEHSERADEAALAQWKAHYPNLPAQFLAWLASGNQTALTGSIEEQTYEYRLFNLTESLARRAEFLDWLNLHRDVNPDLHADLWQSIRESGIDPAQMVPILGAAHCPDGLLVRCDGGDECGAIYLWRHDEMVCFDKIADQPAELMSWLQKCLAEGDPLVL